VLREIVGWLCVIAYWFEAGAGSVIKDSRLKLKGLLILCA